MTFFSPIARTAALLADLAFPPRCPSCRSDVAADGNFCQLCFDKLHMISAPLCAQCGIPFAVPMEADARCPGCLATPPRFERARAVMVYDGVSAPLISALKFHDQWAGLTRHAQMMMGAGGTMLAHADMLIPVPLHWRRLASRRYNQSALLAYGISRLSGIECHAGLLMRIRATSPQMRLKRKARKGNVHRAFVVPPKAVEKVKDKIVVLIDDVITTGATADACARALKRAGAKEVRVLALARTVRE